MQVDRVKMGREITPEEASQLDWGGQEPKTRRIVCGLEVRAGQPKCYLRGGWIPEYDTKNTITTSNFQLFKRADEMFMESTSRYIDLLVRGEGRLV